MGHNLLTWVLFSVSLVILLTLLFWARERGKKTWPNSSARNPFVKSIPIFAFFLGAFLGSLLPSWLSEQNLLIRLTYSLFIFFLIGLPEVLLIRRLPAKLSSAYLLDGNRFPFFALGFSGTLFLFR